MHGKYYTDIVAAIENGYGYISRCVCCEEFNVTYKNVLLVFNEESMKRFFDWISSSRLSPENYQPLPHGRNRIYSSPHSNLYLVYNDCELDELSQLFGEAKLILEARRIASAGRNTSNDMDYPEEGI